VVVCGETLKEVLKGQFAGWNGRVW